MCSIETGDRIMGMMQPGVYFDRTQETPEAKARWFQSLTLAERMEILCAYTDMILAVNPRIADVKHAEQSSDRIRILAHPRG